MELMSLLAFAGVALVAIVVPGPDWVFVLGASVRHRVVFPAVAGLVIGYVILTGIVAAGLGPLIVGFPPALTIIAVIGAGYLAYLGVGALRTPATITTEPTSVKAPRAILPRGIGVSGLNPKALLFFLAILPQFVQTAHGWPAPAQLATLGGIYIVICAAIYLSLGAAADRIIRSRPRAGQVISRISGAIMILVGAGLLVEQILRLTGVLDA
jgi:threonine/homoserine/homoserine lactone efflux protein